MANHCAPRDALHLLPRQRTACIKLSFWISGCHDLE